MKVTFHDDAERDLFHEQMALLRMVSEGMENERTWFQKHLGECRTELEEEIKQGWSDEEDRNVDRPMFRRASAERHAENLAKAAGFTGHLVDLIESLLGPDEGIIQEITPAEIQ